MSNTFYPNGGPLQVQELGDEESLFEAKLRWWEATGWIPLLGREGRGDLKFMRATNFDFPLCTIYQSFELDVTLSQLQLFHNKDTDKINWMQLSRYLELTTVIEKLK